MNYTEKALVFDCQGDSLVGVLTAPEQSSCPTGVIVVVGGPQYRVGSHRHFVLLSRALAEAGIPCLRFDYRGMGDSTGDSRDFLSINDDIRAAVDTLLQQSDNLNRIILWGLCDGATAAACYAAEDSRIAGLVFLNPWVHTDHAEAKVYLKHYYLQRLTSGAFWRKLVSGEVRTRFALRGLLDMVRRTRARDALSTQAIDNESLPQRLYRWLTSRSLPTAILLSGKDFVAQEFESLITTEPRWSRLMKTIQLERLPNADHTFSQPAEAARAIRLTVAWVTSQANIT
ncbi:hydrolase 1, exosortase A system-associated [Lentisalinibacter orientalis]|uniref:hydrolase 1, exosortase A system-associated n=1 Tax=Lentisalinibacter orientalis TaxID=2992241 RepID=UPI00387003C4